MSAIASCMLLVTFHFFPTITGIFRRFTGMKLYSHVTSRHATRRNATCRLRQVDVTESPELKAALGIRVVPTVKVYGGALGQVASFSCGPSKVHDAYCGLLLRTAVELHPGVMMPITLVMNNPLVRIWRCSPEA